MKTLEYEATIFYKGIKREEKSTFATLQISNPIHTRSQENAEFKKLNILSGMSATLTAEMTSTVESLVLRQ
jgi:hypothetical protein